MMALLGSFGLGGLQTASLGTSMLFQSKGLMQLSEWMHSSSDRARVREAGVESDGEFGSLTRVMNMTVRIVTAYVERNEVGVEGLVSLIGSTRDTLSGIESGLKPAGPAAQEPAVPLDRSINDQYLVCLEDGRKLKTLKRHLHAAYGMTPEQYRLKWHLPPDYPMVAPAYSRQRSAFARKSGLGRKP